MRKRLRELLATSISASQCEASTQVAWSWCSSLSSKKYRQLTRGTWTWDQYLILLTGKSFGRPRDSWYYNHLEIAYDILDWTQALKEFNDVKESSSTNNDLQWQITKRSAANKTFCCMEASTGSIEFNLSIILSCEIPSWIVPRLISLHFPPFWCHPHFLFLSPPNHKSYPCTYQRYLVP